MNINLLLPLALCAAVVFCAQQLRLGAAQENIARLESEASALRSEIERWQVAYEQASRSSIA